MFTIFIIIVIIAIIASCRKDKHNAAEDAAAISTIPPFSIYSKPMNDFSKFINLAVNKSQLLKTFLYDNQQVTIIMENEQALTCPLSMLTVQFQKSYGLISYIVKSPDQKVSFYQTTNISDNEWTAINGVLCLAATTYGREIFSKSYKTLGYVNTVLKVIQRL